MTSIFIVAALIFKTEQWFSELAMKSSYLLFSLMILVGDLIRLPSSYDGWTMKYMKREYSSPTILDLALFWILKYIRPILFYMLIANIQRLP